MPPCFCWRIHHTCSWSRGQNHVRIFWFTCCPCNAHVYFSRHLNLFSGSCARFITLSHNESWFWLVRACPPGTQTWHAGKVPAMTRSPGSGCCWSRARKTDPGTRPVIQKSTGVEGNSTNSDRMWQACEKNIKKQFHSSSSWGCGHSQPLKMVFDPFSPVVPRHERKQPP